MRSLFVLAALFFALPADASTVVADTFGPGDSYDAEENPIVIGDAPGPPARRQEVASPFSPSASGFLSDIWLAISLHSGPNEVVFWIMDDNGGKPGSILETFNLVGQMPLSPPSSPLQVVADGTTFLSAGTQYWLAASAPDPDTFARWHRNSIKASARMAVKDFNSTDWGLTGGQLLLPAFRVASNPDPPCNDGIDNDEDGLIDYPNDPGCFNTRSSSENPQCQDGLDNDGDGYIDYPDDPGCLNAFSFVEQTLCQNGIDDDGDTLIDFDGGQSIHGECSAGTCPANVSDPDMDGVADPDPECLGAPW